MIHDASFETDGPERSDLTPFDRVTRPCRGRWYSGRTEVSFVSSRVDITSTSSTSWKNRASPFTRKINTHPSPPILSLSLSLSSISPLSSLNLSSTRKKEKNRKFIVTLTVNLSLSLSRKNDIFVGKNLNPLEHEFSRCFERLTPSFSCSRIFELRIRVTKFLDGKEKKEGKK